MMHSVTAPHKLWRFHGGLHLPENKLLSTGQAIAAAALPSQLVVPLRQHIGKMADPVVKVGEKVFKGQLIAEAEGDVGASIHASSSGTVVAIEDRPVAHPSGLAAPCIVIATDGKDQWGELPQPIADYRALSADELRARIGAAGIVGMGGAAFPTSVKLKTGSQNPISALIINGAECEPYITCDDMLMRENAERIVQGIGILQFLLSAQECLIGIEDNKPEALQAMQAAIAGADIENVAAIKIPTIYPSGGEKQLTRILTGKEIPSGGLPADIGIVCHNVATAAAVADAVLDGRPLISRIVTVTGKAVKAPGNLEVLVGTPVAELIQQRGGYTEAFSRLILGGPMMGFSLSTDNVSITKAANCLLVADTIEAPPAEPESPCIRCGECARVCPANLLPQQLYWHARAKDLEKAQDYNLFDCIECGCCSHVCPAHIPLVQYYRYAKTETWAKEKERGKADHARQRHEARLARLDRMERERKARLRKKKEVLDKGGPDTTSTIKDPKKAAIEAAMQRVAEKKAAQQQPPRNVDNLTSAQQRQVEAADRRRKLRATSNASNESENAMQQD